MSGGTADPARRSRRQGWGKSRLFSGIHNLFSKAAFGRFLRETRPDVVHIHNLYPLISPSILPACTAQGIPVVMTVHNFRLACPNGLLLSHGEVCHRCLGGREYWCVFRNCEDSFFKSAGYALRTAAARMLRRYYDHVDHFLCLSAFQRDLLIREGMPGERHPDPYRGGAPAGRGAF
jgi:glycosyltransferase involved in cell wall biosynthesis